VPLPEVMSVLSLQSCTYPLPLQTTWSTLKPSRHNVPSQLMGICKFGAKLQSLRATDTCLNLEKSNQCQM